MECSHLKQTRIPVIIRAQAAMGSKVKQNRALELPEIVSGFMALGVILWEACFVPTEDSAPIGKALLPMQGAGKVRVGQRALIRLEGFPEQEYGFLEGKVTSIPPVPDEGGNFVVEITPTQGLKTHYGKVLPVMKVMMGTAEIVTEERSLLERLMEF